MNNPSISIIIPIYKVEQYIMACLDSIIAQDYTGKIECILVDDCGGDSSIAIAQERIASYDGPISFIILKHDHNRGLSAARNTGISHAKGDYVLFVDSDDELTPNAISSLTKPLSERHYDFVIGDYRVVGTDKEYPPLLLDDKSILLDNEVFCTYLYGKWYMMAIGKLVNRDFLLNNRLFFLEGIIHEDDLWSFELAYRAKSMAVTKDCCYIYKIREGSITTNSSFEKRLKSRLKIRNCIHDLIWTNHIRPTFELNNYIQTIDFGILLDCYLHCGKRLFKKTYHSIRQTNFRAIDTLRINRLDARKQIRDAHLLFPEAVGRQIIWLITKLYNKLLSR